MSDRHLCKAKRKDNGEWIVGFYHWTNWRDPQTGDIVEITHSILPIDYQDSYHVDPSTICQCTGLPDKNGKLIWENDIVTIPGDDEPCLISWDEECANWSMEQCGCYMYDFDNFWSSELEVIGNAIDTPSLLEGGAEC